MAREHQRCTGTITNEKLPLVLRYLMSSSSLTIKEVPPFVLEHHRIIVRIHDVVDMIEEGTALDEVVDVLLKQILLPRSETIVAIPVVIAKLPQQDGQPFGSRN